MSGDFLDSNVFVYMVDRQYEGKRSIADELVTEAIASGRGSISHQVVQETLNVVTAKIAMPMAANDAFRFFEAVMEPLWTVMPSRGLYREAVVLRERYQYSFYDSLIIAAALQAGCDRLVTDDFQHGQRIEGLTIHNPFL